MAVVQYNPENNTASGNVGVLSYPAEPAAARVVVRDGKILLKSGINGSIIAVSYEARARGVTRFFRGREALAQCPEIVLVQVPTAHGKSDMGVYRAYGARTLKLVRETCGAGALVEKASVDEMYVDLTAPAKAYSPLPADVTPRGWRRGRTWRGLPRPPTRRVAAPSRAASSRAAPSVQATRVKWSARWTQARRNGGCARHRSGQTTRRCWRRGR